MTISIDFDGSCVTHEFPAVGKDIGAVPVLKRLVAEGHELILFTMRSDNEKGNYLTDAVNWFKENDIPLYGIQTNPTQHTWTSSPKCYAQLYIDDAALGCPLVSPGAFVTRRFGGELVNATGSDRPYVNWQRVEQMLMETGVLGPKP